MQPTPIPQKLIDLFNAAGLFEKDAQTYIELNIQTRLIRKKEFFLKPGETCREILFVEKGLLRSYYEGAEKEITNWFMQENQLVISVNSFFTQTPADEYVQAIEDCMVWPLRYEHYQYLFAHYHSFCLIALKLTEYYYMLSEQRLRIMRQKDAEARYRYLLMLHPEIMNRAPLGHIATYLGIKQETLSRLRAKKF
jgi:CRP/FNR family transcriptional regulator, anaerobic regulatory protein